MENGWNNTKLTSNHPINSLVLKGRVKSSEQSSGIPF